VSGAFEDSEYLGEPIVLPIVGIRNVRFGWGRRVKGSEEPDMINTKFGTICQGGDFGVVGAVHRQDQIRIRKCFNTCLAATMIRRGVAGLGEGSSGASIHVFAEVITRSARGGDADSIRQARFPETVPEYGFGHRRATNIAETDTVDSINHMANLLNYEVQRG
jgi:hypothetical protein